MRGPAVGVVAIIALFVLTGDAAEPSGVPLGSPAYRPSPDRPVGWRGDWTGRFPGATPPTEWSRRIRGATTDIRYQAEKPAGDSPAGSRPLEYFTIKDWLVAGPFAAEDPARDIEKDFLGGEDKVAPAAGARAARATWQAVHVGIGTQARHEHNEGTCGDANVDFVYVYGNLPPGGAVKTLDTPLDNQVAYASPVVHDGRVYTVDRAANFYVIDAGTGKTVLKKTLPLPPAGGTDSPNVYPSICLAGKRLLVSNDAGRAVFIEPGDRGALVGDGTLPAGCGATPAFSGGRVFIRGGAVLYCLAAAGSRTPGQAPERRLLGRGNRGIITVSRVSKTQGDTGPTSRCEQPTWWGASGCIASRADRIPAAGRPRPGSGQGRTLRKPPRRTRERRFR